MPLVSAHKDFPQFFKVLDPNSNPGLYTAWKGDVVRQSVPRWMSRPYRLKAIARAAFEQLAEGLIVPSARLKGGVNIVFFPSHRRDGTLIQTLDEANVPFTHGL